VVRASISSWASIVCLRYGSVFGAQLAQQFGKYLDVVFAHRVPAGDTTLCLE
jgi:hypothetical protein